MRNLRISSIVTIVMINVLLGLATTCALAMSIQFTAEESGLSLKYDLNKLGSDEVTLVPGGSEEELSLGGILGRSLRIMVRVDSVTADSPIPAVNTVFKIVIPNTDPIELPVPLPLGEYGVEIGLFSRKQFEIKDAQIEASLVCGLNQTNYKVNIDLGAIYKGNWEGISNLGNNIIKEEIVLDLSSQGFNRRFVITIIPVKNIPITFFMFNIDVYDEKDLLLKSLSGFIPLPNGTYHIWMNPGFDIFNLIHSTTTTIDPTTTTSTELSTTTTTVQPTTSVEPTTTTSEQSTSTTQPSTTTTSTVEPTTTTTTVEPTTTTVDLTTTIPVPGCAGAAPVSADQGATLAVTITGVDTNFSNGVTITSFSGSGITVNSTQVNSATEAIANITIASDAPLGARDVTATTNSEIVTCTAAFTITAVPVTTSTTLATETSTTTTIEASSPTI